MPRLLSSILNITNKLCNAPDRPKYAKFSLKFSLEKITLYNFIKYSSPTTGMKSSSIFKLFSSNISNITSSGKNGIKAFHLAPQGLNFCAME